MTIETGRTTRPRILLVDDDEMIRELLRDLLEVNEFNVTIGKCYRSSSSDRYRVLRCAGV